jgi:hypothetical protein
MRHVPLMSLYTPVAYSTFVSIACTYSEVYSVHTVIQLPYFSF